MRNDAAVWTAILTVLLAVCPPAGADDGLTPEERAWLEGETEETTRHVNGGDLEFLTAPPQDAVHYHQNRIVIDAASLADGWIQLTQCHRHLDAVPRAEILFRAGHIRNLAVAESRGIDRTWVEGASVQLEGVGATAYLCLTAESQALHQEGDGLYVLRNGPYMRRFLDGYYPMRVSLTVELNAPGLEWVAVDPEPQSGFQVARRGSDLHIDTWFAGQLRTALYFMVKG